MVSADQGLLALRGVQKEPFWGRGENFSAFDYFQAFSIYSFNILFVL